MDAVLAYDLSKDYGRRSVLRGVTFQVQEGDILSCVGKKGAGKTTLIRLLSGLCRPTAGEASILGFSPFFEAAKLHAVMGTVLDTAHLYQKMTLTENLRFFAEINGVEENDAIDRMSFLMHRLEIWEGRDELVADLPTDVLRRASVARALMHSPRVLLLDEPADGLDTEAAGSIQTLLAYLRDQEGVTTLVCTEDMDFAQCLGDEFALLQEGALMARGDLETLRKNAGVRYRAVLRLGEEETAPKGFRFVDGVWEKEIPSEEELPKIIAQAVSNGTKLYEARLIKPTLEEVYEAYLAGGIQRAGEIDEQGDEDDEYEEQTEVTEEAGYAGFSAPAAGEQPEYETDGSYDPEA